MSIKEKSPRILFPALVLIALVSISGYLIASRLTYRMGYPLDDAWIHQTYARNLGMHGEWAFIPGQPSAGSTSPLWSSLLAIGFILGLGPYFWTYLLGWLTLLGSALVGIWIYRRISLSRQEWAWLAGGILLLEWHLVWAAVSGMETSLFCLLVLVVLAWLVKERQNWFTLGALIGLSVWIRPDGLTLLGPAALTGVLHASNHRERATQLMFLSGGFVLLAGPYLIWNRSLSGAWWPNTFYAKQAEYAVELLEPLWKRLFEQALLPNMGVGILVLPGFVYMLLRLFRGRQWGALAGAIWAVGYLVLYALRLPVTYQHGRYVMPMMPVYFIWGLAGVMGIIKSSSPVFWKRILSRAWLASIIFVCIVFWFLGARAYGRDVAFIESEMVETARWVSTNIEDDALVAAHDIGALGYFGEHNLLDLAGLVSPEVVPFIRDETRLAEWLDIEKADYLVTFPSWYPELTRTLEPIYQAEGRYSQAFDGEGMAVYRWELRIR